jgi:hypothetical protein
VNIEGRGAGRLTQGKSRAVITPEGRIGSLLGASRCGRAFGLLALTSSPAALAQSPAPADASVEIHAFVSQGYLHSTDNNYLGPSERGSFEFTEAGINFTHSASDRLRVGLQIFAHDLGPLGNYAPQFDWYYLDYLFWDWLGFRAGRTKIPFGLYNEFLDIDAARVAVLLPQSVYPAASREFLLAQTGAEFYGHAPLGAAGRLEYRLYGGTIFLNPDNISATLRDFTVPYMMGARLMWLPLDGLSIGGSIQRLRLEFEYLPTPEELAEFQMIGALPSDFVGPIEAQLPAWLWALSAEYQTGDLLIAAEYTESHTRLEGDLAGACTRGVGRGAYASASYRALPWLSPGAYLAAQVPDPCGRTGSDKRHYDVAATLRFDVTEHWLFKVEGHFMSGTAQLDRTLNDNTSGSELTSEWGLLLLKTTAYF